MTKCYGVCPNAVFWAPFFCNDFGQADNTCFCQTIVGLTSIPVNTGRRGDIYDTTRFTVSNAEERGGLSNELEWGGIVDSNDIVPLLVRHLSSSRDIISLVLHFITSDLAHADPNLADVASTCCSR